MELASRQTMWRSVKKGLGSWRYLKIVILVLPESTIVNGWYIQIGEWEFLDNKDNVFQFPSSTKPIAYSSDMYDPVKGNNINPGSQGISSLFDGDVTRKFCWCASGGATSQTCPCYVVLDLGSECLDLTTYNRYRWYTGDDTATYPSRSPRSWAVYVSNDNVSWTLIDFVIDQETPAQNKVVAYAKDNLKKVRNAQAGYNLSVQIIMEDYTNTETFYLSGYTSTGLPFYLTHRFPSGQYKDDIWLYNFETSVDISKPFVIENALSGIDYDSYMSYAYYGFNGTNQKYVDSTLNFDTFVRFVCYYCLESTTLISMADGSVKMVKDLNTGDKVMSLDPFTLKMVEDEVTYCDGSQMKFHDEKDIWTFEDGTVIETIHPHEFFNARLGRMAYLADFIVGEDFAKKIDGSETRLVKHETVHGKFHHATLFTKKYNNYFAAGLLSGNRNSLRWGREDCG